MSTPPTAKRTSKRWIWFFAVLAGLTVAAISLEIWYNLGQQLKPEGLEAARRQWQEKGPHSYRAEYLIRTHDRREQRYLVTVEDGTATAIEWISGQPVAPGEYPFGTVDTLFSFVAEKLQADAQPDAPRVFATAVFDRGDGHILRYVRSVRNPRERLEVTVQLRPREERQAVPLPRTPHEALCPDRLSCLLRFTLLTPSIGSADKSRQSVKSATTGTR